VTGPATEVPALAFAYFDPKKQMYRTIHSDPIALSVKGGSVVSATDVVVNRRSTTKPDGDDRVDVDVTAQLALSSEGVGDTPLGGSLLWVLVAMLYAVPLGLLGS
jgi:hypothetical protein